MLTCTAERIRARAGLPRPHTNRTLSSTSRLRRNPCRGVARIGLDGPATMRFAGLEEQNMGPLAGIRVVDLSSMLSGPWATMILADQGADVIKVEEPKEGDHTRSLSNRHRGFSAQFLNLNRNKRSITLDLKTGEGGPS